MQQQQQQQTTRAVGSSKTSFESCDTTRTTSSTTKNLGEYDYVIVGAGASAMGLLLGLLLQDNNDGPTDDDTSDNNNNNNNNDIKVSNRTTSNNIPLPSYTIAVIERGTANHHWYTDKLSDWPKASQLSNSTSTTLYNAQIQEQSKQQQQQQTKQSLLSRYIDVCVGQGLGGTTNINAGLLIPPSSVTDFIHWPDTIRTNITNSIQCILDTMDTNNCIGYTTKTATPSANPTKTATPSANPTKLYSSFSEQYRYSTDDNRWWDIPVPTIDMNNYNKDGSVEQQQQTSRMKTCYQVPCMETSEPLVVSNNDNEHYSPSSSSSSSSHRRRRYRRNYYDALVAPIINQSSSNQNNNNNNNTINDMVQFYTNYTAQRLLFDSTDISNNSSATANTTTTTTRTCTGVEVLCNVTGTYCTISARKDVIVCAGAIESPALLLVSGIGHSNDNNNNNNNSHPNVDTDYCNRTKQYQTLNVDRTLGSSTNTYYGNVGGNLRDHMVIPRVYWNSTRCSYYYNTKNDDELSKNCTRAISNICISTKKVDTDNNDDTNTDTTRTSIDDSYRSIRGQYLLTDITSLTDIIPLLVAAVIRYSYPPLLFHTESKPTIIYDGLFKYSMNGILYSLYTIARTLLFILVCYTPIYYILRYCITVVIVAITNCESTGTIKLRNKYPNNNIVPLRREQFDIDINLGYFSDKRDWDALVKVWEGSTNAFPELGYEIFPTSLISCPPTSEESTKNNNSILIEYGRRFAMSFFHYVGTCRMKLQQEVTVDKNSNDDDNIIGDWVVDEYFRVRKIKSLRVCDASIFPTLISSPTALTCAAIGHILATILRAEQQTVTT